MTSEDERRRSERVPVNDEFERLDGDGVAYVSNLSDTGVFVHTRQLVPIGSKIELRFTLLLDDPVLIEASGEVVRHQTGDDPGMGIRFGPLSPQTVLRIKDAIGRLRPLDSGSPVKSNLPSHLSADASSAGSELESQITGVFRKVGDVNTTQRLPALTRDGEAWADDDDADEPPTDVSS